jgi:membrane protein YqaA with SNARE-associated domain
MTSFNPGFHQLFYHKFSLPLKASETFNTKFSIDNAKRFMRGAAIHSNPYEVAAIPLDYCSGMAIRRFWSSNWWAEKIKPNAERIAEHPRAEVIVGLLELTGLAIFPIPVALLLVALVTAAPRKWLRFAISATLGSTIGSAILYIIGMAFFQSLGQRLISFYGAQESWSGIVEKFDSQFGIGFILLAGLTTGLMRIASLGAGLTAMNPLLFLGLIFISRSLRFIAECAAIKYTGEKAKTWPRHYKYASIAIVGAILITLVVITLTK